MADDAQRALHDFDQMADAYADDAAVDPVKTAYDRPAMLSMVGDVEGRRVLDVGCAAGVLSELLVERGGRSLASTSTPDSSSAPSSASRGAPRSSSRTSRRRCPSKAARLMSSARRWC